MRPLQRRDTQRRVLSREPSLSALRRQRRKSRFATRSDDTYNGRRQYRSLAFVEKQIKRIVPTAQLCRFKKGGHTEHRELRRDREQRLLLACDCVEPTPRLRSLIALRNSASVTVYTCPTRAPRAFEALGSTSSRANITTKSISICSCNGWPPRG